MKNLNMAKKSVLGNMIIRQTMGGTRKEDKIRDKDTLKERIKEEYERQDSKTTHELNLTMLDVSLVEDMSELFLGFNYLKSIDVSNWNVGNVRNMGSMFYGCKSLKSIDVSNWDVRNVENMIGMFYECSSLESINVSKWDISKCRNISGMFYRCSSLKSIDVSHWDVSSVESMEDMEYMFYKYNFDYKKEDNKLYKV